MFKAPTHAYTPFPSYTFSVEGISFMQVLVVVDLALRKCRSLFQLKIQVSHDCTMSGELHWKRVVYARCTRPISVQPLDTCLPWTTVDLQ